jgi:hypothetical protein
MAEQQAGQSRSASKSRSLYLSIALFASQIGCLSLVIIIAALFGGRWLDSLFGTNPIFTIVLMVGSVPFVLAVSLWLAKRTASGMRLDAGPKNADPAQGEKK